MGKSNYYYIELEQEIEMLLRQGEFLGCGHNGIVYLLPDNKIIKIFKEKEVCKGEYEILKRVKGSKYFPIMYSYGDYYIVREFVGGVRLDKYIKKKGINKTICKNLVKLIEEFKNLKFTRLDIRCKDLYLDDNFNITVIDPKNNYSKNVIYPRHLMKGLNKLGVLKEFLQVVSEENSKDYELWSYRMDKYIREGIK